MYFAVFKPADSAEWNGNIKRYRLGKALDNSGETMIRDVNGSPAIDTTTGFFANTARSFWPEKTDGGTLVAEPDGNTVARGGAANQLSLKTDESGEATRKVYTWVNSAATPIGMPVDLTAESRKLHEDNDAITDEILNIEGTKDNSVAQSIYRQSLLTWARGVDVLDDDKDDNTSEIRKSMGDPMHSRPVIVNYAPKTSGGDVRSLIYVGTNQGFLHAFDTSDGAEQFAYIPYELLGNLNTFYRDKLGFSRPYGLDGPISIWRDDANDNQMVDAGEDAMLFVGMRRGGKSYYALDISNPDVPKLAWTIKSGSIGFETLGQTWSRMTPVKMHINGATEHVLVFGGGYDENQDPENIPEYSISHPTDDEGAGIYIVRASTGELLWSGLGVATGTRQFTNMDYGFNGNIRTIDINRDGLVDQMYAADAGGQLWRFDVRSPDDTTGNLVDGGVIAQFSSVGSSSNRRFFNEPDIALVQHDGETFLSVSIGSGWRANPLEDKTSDRFYMVRQYAVYEKPEVYGHAAFGTPLAEWNLENVTGKAKPSGNELGWYLEMTDAGEKVLGTSVTFDNKVIFSSYLPAKQIEECAAEAGSGRAYILDVATGAPVFNLDKDGAEDETDPILSSADRRMDLTRSGIPPEAMVMISEDEPNSPQVLIGGEKLEVDINNSTRRTFWSDEGEDGEITISESERE